jgi:hypothetical protein
MPNDAEFKLDSPEGHSFARRLLRLHFPPNIHDCVLAVVKTGGSKSSYFSAYIHLLRALDLLWEPDIGSLLVNGSTQLAVRLRGCVVEGVGELGIPGDPRRSHNPRVVRCGVSQ